MPRRFYIQTVGCQMNVLDSELVAAELLRAGHQQVDRLGRADVILLNTCSVRQHAEDKIYSALGRLKVEKQQRPDMIIGVLGCMAQKDQHAILRRAPHVDLVVGPGQLARLPALIDEIAAGGLPRVEVSLDRTVANRVEVGRSFVQFAPQRPATFQAMVRIMLGCDKFCSYCIVPSVRGPEQSRPAAEILDEVRYLADQGCLEVTLLGQAVNSYKDTSGPRTIELADLLCTVHQIEGVRRLRFVTNHPRHMTPALIQAVRDLPKVSPYFHVPAQSGANAVLRRMNRGYTAEYYREMLARIREMVPGAAITSDFIVGFCGETEEEFLETAALVRDARFKNSFVFKYSGRPGTKAAELYEDDVPEVVKRRRNNDLLAIQNAICLEDNQPFLGRTVEILVEGPSKVAKKRRDVSPLPLGEGQGVRASDATENANCKLQIANCNLSATNPQSPITEPYAGSPHPSPLPKGEGTTQLVGRTTCDRIVVFDGPPHRTGRLLSVVIERVDAFTLFGSETSSGDNTSPTIA
jgi:tRNA-2-methylthio-N6-dimethylallyladenosine synthase